MVLFVMLRGGLAARKRALPLGPFLSLGLIVPLGPHITTLVTG